MEMGRTFISPQLGPHTPILRHPQKFTPLAPRTPSSERYRSKILTKAQAPSGPSPLCKAAQVASFAGSQGALGASALFFVAGSVIVGAPYQGAMRISEKVLGHKPFDHYLNRPKGSKAPGMARKAMGYGIAGSASVLSSVLALPFMVGILGFGAVGAFLEDLSYHLGHSLRF